MTTVKQYEREASRAVTETAQSFHLQAETKEGLPLSVPCSYQIREPGFRPLRAGKATALELQTELDNVLAQAKTRGVDMGIEGQESIRKLSVQLGLGIDCSNFAFRSLFLLHERLGLGQYENNVYRLGSEIRELYEHKASWAPKNKDGLPRPLSEDESIKLNTSELLDAGWISSVFGKDPEFIIGSHHMSNSEAAVRVDRHEALPGDLIAFQKAGNGVVSHVVVIESVDTSDKNVTIMDFWHSWHTRNFQSGLRRDRIQAFDEFFSFSHEGLADSTRYRGHYFCRPIGMAALTASFDVLTRLQS